MAIELLTVAVVPVQPQQRQRQRQVEDEPRPTPFDERGEPKSLDQLRSEFDQRRNDLVARRDDLVARLERGQELIAVAENQNDYERKEILTALWLDYLARYEKCCRELRDSVAALKAYTSLLLLPPSNNNASDNKGEGSSNV